MNLTCSVRFMKQKRIEVNKPNLIEAFTVIVF